MKHVLGLCGLVRKSRPTEKSVNCSAVWCKTDPTWTVTFYEPVCFSSWLIRQSRLQSAPRSTNEFYGDGHCLKHSPHWLNSAGSVRTGPVIFGPRKILHQITIKFRTIHFTITGATVTRNWTHYINLTSSKILVTLSNALCGHELLYASTLQLHTGVHQI